ncbi:MAG: hypothetical protein RJB66_2065 [Pseudomonadota bacterium]
MRVTLQIIFVLVGLTFVFGASTVNAQTSNEEPKKKHTLNFEDELIEGGIQKPELMYLLQRKNFNFKKLIRLREHFLPEMVESGEMLRGSGSNN